VKRWGVERWRRRRRRRRRGGRRQERKGREAGAGPDRRTFDP